MPKYIDLTLNLESGMRGVSVDVARRIEKDGWNATTFHLYSHAGTHMDAPLHFDRDNGINTIDVIPVERFFVDSYLIDVSTIGDKGLILPSHLGDVIDKIKAGEGLIFKTGWSQYVGEDKFRDDLPRISKELVKWCIDKKVGLIGVEPPSIADVNNPQELTEIHALVLDAGIMIVEGLCNLEAITQEKVHLVSLPLRVKGADGAPARVVAIEE
ncbi:cyclase family protein [Labilibacter marinus]|uniref:cyclase family protein n=1 Tax=Labilibacter marinus TaxID=1477105 RepID=UPI00082FE9B6|nr:cyclase family protein [Labilibacter marinus]